MYIYLFMLKYIFFQLFRANVVEIRKLKSFVIFIGKLFLRKKTQGISMNDYQNL